MRRRCRSRPRRSSRACSWIRAARRARSTRSARRTARGGGRAPRAPGGRTAAVRGGHRSPPERAAGAAADVIEGAGTSVRPGHLAAPRVSKRGLGSNGPPRVLGRSTARGSSRARSAQSAAAPTPHPSTRSAPSQIALIGVPVLLGGLLLGATIALAHSPPARDRRCAREQSPHSLLSAVVALASGAPTAMAVPHRQEGDLGAADGERRIRIPHLPRPWRGDLRDDLNWAAVAPNRPRNPRDPRDPAYKWSADVDYALRQAARYHMRVLLQVSQTPGWANGGRAANYPPPHLRRPGELRHGRRAPVPLGAPVDGLG